MTEPTQSADFTEPAGSAENLPPPPAGRPAAAASPASPERRGGIRLNRLAWGLVLLVLGAFLLLERLNLFYLDEYFRYWPLLIVAGVLLALGGVSLATSRAAEQRHSALWLLALGGWFLLNALELFGFWFHNSWPLIIIAAGVVDLLQPKPGESRVKGFWPLAIGFWLLINTLGLWGFYWDDSWPLLLIFLGAVLVVQALAGSARSRAAGGAGEE